MGRTLTGLSYGSVSDGRRLMLPSGEQIAIAHGDQRAVVTEVGATLRDLRQGRRPGRRGLRRRGDADGRARPGCSSRGPIAWATARGRSRTAPPSPTVDDVEHATADPRPRALAALPRRRGQPEPLRADAAVAPRRPSYPFLTRDRRGLPPGLARAHGHDDGDQSRRRADALRPGLPPLPRRARPRPSRAPTSRSRAKAYVAVDDRQLPTGEILPVAGGAARLHARQVGQRPRARRDLHRAGARRPGLATARLRDSTGGEVELSVDRNFPYLQVFTGDNLERGRRRTSVAVEPMTCPPDALRSGKDIVVLEPGQHWAGSWRLRRTTP